MRLERLEIRGFGRVSQLELDLGSRLTVLVGGNESGKSTILRALRAALYGMDAGGQGRPTERSDWSRWTPWDGGQYALALTYQLGDGRRFRVARRLGHREQSAQVVELGGGEITELVRAGRRISPGDVHLGIPEAVFCASGCLAEEGLRLGAADAPQSRVEAVQASIERLADTARGITAREAVARLREAAGRVGSERRPTSPLGAAVNRLRQLDAQVDMARRHLHALATEEERLRHLELSVTAADEQCRDAGRRWLAGRLASLAAERRELDDAAAETSLLTAEADITSVHAAAPLELEERVIQLAAELQEARRSAAEADARATAGRDPLRLVRRRRAEISGGIRALGSPPLVDESSHREAIALHGELDELASATRREDRLATAGARRVALRRELAATGLSGVRPAAAEEAIRALEPARGKRSSLGGLRLASLFVSASGIAGAALLAHRTRPLLAAVAAVVTALLALSLLGLARFRAGDSDQAHRRLRRLCPGFPLDEAGLDRLADRLPRALALHQELEREELRLETLGEDLEVAAERIAELGGRVVALADRCAMPAPELETLPDPTGMAAVLRRITEAAAVRHRVTELDTEDALLAQREHELAAVAADASERADHAAALEARLSHLLDGAAIDASHDLDGRVIAFREACRSRLRHEQLVRRLGELRHRLARCGDGAGLEATTLELRRRLLELGGSPEEVAQAPPLGQAALHELETRAERARKQASVAATQAAELRARLAATWTSLPSIADLEDERAACLAARERALHQLEALRRAEDLIEAATRGVHHELAPQLAESVGERLAMITDGRYASVNVDTAHFAVALLSRERPDLVPLELVSHGTRDQVALLLRLALSEVLSTSGERLPMLLDEPLLSADRQRRGTALRFIWNLSATNQVLLSASDPEVAQTLQDLGGDDVVVITLGPTAKVMEAVGRPVRGVRVVQAR